MIKIAPIFCFFTLAMFMAGTVSAETFVVGPGQRYAVPSDAAAVAANGDTVEFVAGEYHGDVVVWNQDNLTLRGLGAGAHLFADGHAAEGKGIWVIKGKNILVENLKFSGAKVSDRNGAGIRHSGINLTIRNCTFQDNENGILANKGSGEVRIENSIFSNNGHGDGQSHNIYVGQIDRLTIEASYFHHAYIGHNVKSRARETYISYSKIMDGADGQSSYLVDLPNGGLAVLIGNVLQQGPQSENSSLISYSAESQNSKSGELYLINNTLVNDRHSGLFLNVATPYARVHIQNNIFLGKGNISNRQLRDISNLRLKNDSSFFLNRGVFIDRDGYDYHLAPGSLAIDAGSDPAVAGLKYKHPRSEYRHVAQLADRPTIGPLDIGAFEYAGK